MTPKAAATTTSSINPRVAKAPSRQTDSTKGNHHVRIERRKPCQAHDEIASPISAVSRLAITTIHTMLNTRSSSLVSMRGPGTIPMARKATRRMAMLSPPGIPNARVGMRPPPSLAPRVASGAMTPSTAPLPNPFRRRRGLRGLGVGGDAADAGADARQHAHPQAQQAGTQHKSPVAEGVLHAVQHRAALFATDAVHHGAALDVEGHHFGHGEQPDHRDRKRDAVEQVDVAEPEPRRPAHRVHADKGHHDPQAGGDEPLEQRAFAEGGDDGQSPKRHHQVLAGAEGEHDRTDDGDGEGQEHRAHEAAEQRGHRRRAEGPGGVPLPGHRMAVEHQREALGGARHLEQDAGHGPAPDGRDVGAEQQRQRRRQLVPVGERQQQGQGDDPPQPGQDADHQPVADAHQHEQDRLGRGQRGESGDDRLEHEPVRSVPLFDDLAEQGRHVGPAAGSSASERGW